MDPSLNNSTDSTALKNSTDSTALKNSTDSTASGSDDGLVYLKIAGCILIMILTAVGNLLVCFSVAIFKTLRTKTNAILFSLAVSDLLMIFSMAFSTLIIHHGGWPYSRTSCTVVSSFGLNLCFISILHLCLLSIDRYIGIKKPFKHRDLMSSRRIGLFLVCIWVIPPTSINLPAFTDFEFRASVFGCPGSASSAEHDNPALGPVLVLLFVLIPFGILFYVYMYLFKVVHQHARRITAAQQQSNDLDVRTLDSSVGHQRTRLFGMKKEIKLIKTFALVIGAFLFCYTPFFVLGVLESSKGPGYVSREVLLAVTWLAYCNSFVNPIVYSLRYKHFRESFWKIVCSPRALIGLHHTSIVTKIATTPGANGLPRPDASVIDKSKVNTRTSMNPDVTCPANERRT